MITNYSDHITTDKEEQKEIVSLYNKWHKDVMFLSSLAADNKHWNELENYCMSHKDLTVQFWVDMKHDLGEVGYFTYMLQKIMPGVIKPQGYIPLDLFEHIWLVTLSGKYGKFRGLLIPDNCEEWNDFWNTFEILSQYKNLDNHNMN